MDQFSVCAAIFFMNLDTRLRFSSSLLLFLSPFCWAPLICSSRLAFCILHRSIFQAAAGYHSKFRTHSSLVWRSALLSSPSKLLRPAQVGHTKPAGQKMCLIHQFFFFDNKVLIAHRQRHFSNFQAQTHTGCFSNYQKMSWWGKTVIFVLQNKQLKHVKVM